MAINDTNWALGHKLKNLRDQHGYTLAEVADVIGFTPQFLSMVEKGKSGISFPNLQKIMSMYGLTVADLAEQYDESNRVLRLDQAERLGYDFEGAEARLIYKNGENSRPQAVYFRLEPNATIDFTDHEGEEFAFVVDGVLEFYLIDPVTNNIEKHVLGKGDTIHHSSKMKHKCLNMSNKVSAFIVTTF